MRLRLRNDGKDGWYERNYWEEIDYEVVDFNF